MMSKIHSDVQFALASFIQGEKNVQFDETNKSNKILETAIQKWSFVCFLCVSVNLQIAKQRF